MTSGFITCEEPQSHHTRGFTADTACDSRDTDQICAGAARSQEDERSACGGDAEGGRRRSIRPNLNASPWLLCVSLGSRSRRKKHSHRAKDRNKDL